MHDATRGSTLPTPSLLPATLPEIARQVSATTSPGATYLAALAAGSRPAQAAALRRCGELLTGKAVEASALPWHELRREHVAAVRARMVDEGSAPATVNRYLAALRGVAREAWRSGRMSAEEHARICDVPAVRGSTLPAGRDVSPGELGALFQACAEGGTTGARDAALLALLYGSGMRRAEAVALDLGDYDQESGRLTIERGKGRKSRLAYATNGSKAALDQWLAIRGQEPGPLLCPVGKGGKVVPRHMTTTAVYLRLVALAKRANVQHLSPHDLRRTFVGALLDNGADIATVQALAGHANVSTTARYDRRGERAKAKAAELLHVPFVPVAAPAKPAKRTKRAPKLDRTIKIDLRREHVGDAKPAKVVRP